MDWLRDFQQSFRKAYPASGAFAAAQPAEQLAFLKTVDRTPFFESARILTIIGTLAATKYGGNHEGLGWQMMLPAGWSYASGAGTEGDVKPSIGTTSLLEWAWTTIPSSPVTFTTTLNVPATDTGEKTIAALETHMITRSYEGFMKRGRIRGRR